MLQVHSNLLYGFSCVINYVVIAVVAFDGNASVNELFLNDISPTNTHIHTYIRM